MERALKIVLILGIAFWMFLMWESKQPDPVATYNEYGERIDNAEVDERCAEFRRPVGAGDDWSLGYGDRIRQLVRGCL